MIDTMVATIIINNRLEKLSVAVYKISLNNGAIIVKQSPTIGY
jgi:hypothetical protein